ncbi:MAG: 16S rRNA pseudouridine(516) synthase, partial [Oscillospiraceae bacterium]|nr:16S rRNA pseudouridine(516) synthase [Oscillospiraceae bacterium]
MQTRLDKFISESMAISRADAKKLISKSAITVNGTVVKKSDIKIDTDTVFVLNGGNA